MEAHESSIVGLNIFRASQCLIFIYSLGLGKDGIHSLSTWKEELVRVLDGYEAKTPSTTRHHRRTVHGGETGVPTVVIQKTSSGTLNPVNEDEHVEFGYAVTSDQRRGSVRTFGPTPPTSASVYSDGFNTARSSMATMVDQPPTSATALLHPIYDQQSSAPMPNAETTHKARSYHLPILPIRKSSIVYIKSDDNEQTAAAPVQIDSRASKAEPRPASAKRQIPRTPKTISSDGSTSSPLRKLTLLGNRDLNRKGSGAGTPPLTISKKAKRQADRENDGTGLRPLRLARSATAKARGLLRQDEVLPDVIVRPPSSSDHTGFGYTFRL